MRRGLDGHAQELVLTVGLPGSGKSTLAAAWLAEAPTHRVRVNRDDYRIMLFGLDSPDVWRLPEGQRLRMEDLVTVAQLDAIGAALGNGWSVVVDDTNLRLDRRRDLETLAAFCDIPVRLIDLTSVPLDTCIDRDAARGAAGGRHVGADAIRAMHQQYLQQEVTP